MKVSNYMQWQITTIVMFFAALYIVSLYANKADITTWYYGPNTVILMAMLSAALLAMVFTRWIYDTWKGHNNNKPKDT